MRKNWKKQIFSLMALGIVFGFTNLAMAISVNLVDGDWQNATFDYVGTANTINNSGSTGGLSTIYWGVAATINGQSGYKFQSRPTSFDAPENGTAFTLGDFTHVNQPIYAGGQGIIGAGSLASIDLLLNLGITGLSPFNATFAFSHEETLNTNNELESRDIVTILNPIVNKSFNYNGYTYYFNLLGFSQNNGLTISEVFYTYENSINTASLYGTITSNPITTPEPLTILLVGFGLCGIVGIRKKLNK